MRCGGCSGSGACDPCDGYGNYPDSFPNAGDGLDCEVCDGSGTCTECDGSGQAPGTESEFETESGVGA